MEGATFMKEPGEQNMPIFDWKSFEKLLGGEVPLMLPDTSQKNTRSSSWISDYVQSLLHQAGNPKESVPLASKLDYELFQTKKAVICRIFLPKEAIPEQIRIWINTYTLRLEGIFHNRKRHRIPLPVPVSIKKSTALYEEGILEVNMPKIIKKRKYKEITIRF